MADLNAELYVGGRVYALENVYVDGDETQVDDLYTVLTGVRVRF